MRILYPKSDPLLSSLMQQASFESAMPQLELKSSSTFLCIKRCERTKIGKDIKRSRISIYKLAANMCATSGEAVNR